MSDYTDKKGSEMKHFEDLTRMRTIEAIQTGVKSQSVRRALAGQKGPAAAAQLETERRLNPRKTAWVRRFVLLYQRMLGFVE
jgi:hypothetical protein